MFATRLKNSDADSNRPLTHKRTVKNKGDRVKESRNMWETVIAEIDAMISEPSRLLYVLNN